jgi:uncharacterized protein
MNPYARYGLMALGVIFIILGVIGLFLPFLQGIIFLAIGLYILSLTSKKLKRAIESRLRKYPRAFNRYERYSAKIERILGQKQDKETGKGGHTS